MADTGNLAAALYNVVLGGGGQAGAQSAAGGYLMLEWPGMPVDPARFGNIWTTDRPAGSAEALEAFSSLVDDDLPALGPLFQPAGISLPQIYALILQATAPSGTLAVTFAAAQEKFAAVIRGSLENPGVNFHPTWPQPIGWCDPGNDGLWTKVSIAATAPASAPAPSLPSPLRSLLVRPELMQLRVARPTRLSRPVPRLGAGGDPVDPMALRLQTSALRSQIKAPETTIIQSNQKLFLNAALVAAGSTRSRGDLVALAGKRGMFAAASPTQEAAVGRIAGTKVLASMPQRSAAGAPRAMQIDVSGLEAIRRSPSLAEFIVEQQAVQPSAAATTVPVKVETKPVDTSQVGLSFKYIRVSLRRPWLDTTVLRLKNWTVDGLPAGSISNGSSDANPGMMPVIPIGFLAIKDVEVRGQWSTSDRNSIESAIAGGSIASLGPFTLAAGGSALGGFDGSSLSLPGVSIIAWTCSVMPLLPPL